MTDKDYIKLLLLQQKQTNHMVNPHNNSTYNFAPETSGTNTLEMVIINNYVKYSYFYIEIMNILKLQCLI